MIDVKLFFVANKQPGEPPDIETGPHPDYETAYWAVKDWQNQGVLEVLVPVKSFKWSKGGF